MTEGPLPLDPAALSVLVPSRIARAERAIADDAPACPLCGSQTERRTARSGPRAGIDFWGCAASPPCRGRLDIGGTYGRRISGHAVDPTTSPDAGELVAMKALLAPAVATTAQRRGPTTACSNRRVRCAVRRRNPPTAGRAAPRTRWAPERSRVPGCGPGGAAFRRHPRTWSPPRRPRPSRSIHWMLRGGSPRPRRGNPRRTPANRSCGPSPQPPSCRSRAHGGRRTGGRDRRSRGG